MYCRGVLVLCGVVHLITAVGWQPQDEVESLQARLAKRDTLIDGLDKQVATYQTQLVRVTLARCKHWCV